MPSRKDVEKFTKKEQQWMKNDLILELPSQLLSQSDYLFFKILAIGFSANSFIQFLHQSLSPFFTLFGYGLISFLLMCHTYLWGFNF